jgi:hypothetical protein
MPYRPTSRAARWSRVALIVLSAALGVAVVGAVAVVATPRPAASSFAVVSPSFVQGSCNTWNTPFCNAAMSPLPDWTGHVFQLSQDYPKSPRYGSNGPWRPSIDPKTDPGGYTRMVLAYFYEGNIHGGGIENDFDPARNHVRRWYNAPFQDLGTFGREFVHGLTEERNSSPGELTPQQTSVWANYAVGFYNTPGAMVIGNVWNPWRKAAGARPSIAAAAHVPEGTVGVKLLFTTASTAEAPFIAGAPAWDAYVYKNVHAYPKGPSDPRVIWKVRLLQIDIAVKDHRAGPTGWFFGTFVYGGGPGYAGPELGKGWRDVAPVGLMWGNDPGYTPPPSPTPHTSGLKETWLNPNVNMAHYGYQYRLNGPVDNPVSSCISCHSSGEINRKDPRKAGSGMIAPIPMPTPPATPPPHDIAYWFRNLGPSEPFDKPGFDSTGYSLQVMDGIRNYYQYLGATPAPTAALRTSRFLKGQAERKKVDYRPPRDGGPSH